jgi:hypothetical protein
MALSDSLFEFVSEVDFFLSDPMFLKPVDAEFDCIPPTGQLRAAVLKLRDEADYLRADLDRHPHAEDLPPREVCMPLIRGRRKAEYKQVAERGSYYAAPSADPRIEIHRRNQQAKFRRIGLQETFEYLAEDIDRYLADGYQDWTHHQDALKLRDECLLMNWVFAAQLVKLPAGRGKLLQKIKQMRVAGRSVADTAAIA